MEAAMEGHFEVLQALIQHGANVQDEHNMTTVVMFLCMSSSKNDEELLRCLRLLLENGADPKAANWTLTTPLLMATRSNKASLVAHLLEIGCDVNSEDGEGYTPIMAAATNENLDMVRLLISAGANLKVMDRRGNRLEDLPQVGSNRELAGLLGVDFTNDSVEVVREPSVSNYKRVMREGPKKEDRLYGYHEDALKFVRGIGLYEVGEICKSQNVQLAELLTWNDDEWERAGIHVNYYKKKIALCVKKYHERPWSKTAIPQVSSIVSKEEIDPFLVVRCLLDFLRVAHISSATSLYTLRNCDERPRAKTIQSVKDALNYQSIARQHLRKIRRMFVNYPEPPDLVIIDKPPKRKYSDLSVKFVSFFFELCISWRLLPCSNI